MLNSKVFDHCLLIISIFSIGICHTKGDDPPGHGKPLGSHTEPQAIDVLDDFPSPAEFYEKYVKSSKPVLFRSVLNKGYLPAYSKWDDGYLGQKFGSIFVDVEEGKKEDRDKGLQTMTFAKFLEVYKEGDVYLVQDLYPKMKADLNLLPCLKCGDFHKVLSKVVMWFSSGGTKSVLHNDEFDNINCLFDGNKDLVFIDKVHSALVEADGYNSEKSYSWVDVDKVDMYKFPKFQNLPWFKAHMEKGDCLFIPNLWFHQVNSFGNRNLAVNVWFLHRLWFNESSCDGVNSEPSAPLNTFKLVPGEDFFRGTIINLFEGMASVDKEAFMKNFDENCPNAEARSEVFHYLDANHDSLVTWDELYTFDVDDLVKKFKKKLANDFMAEYRFAREEFLPVTDSRSPQDQHHDEL